MRLFRRFLTHLPATEMQHQLRQVERRRSEAHGLEVRETYEGVASEVDVRRPEVAVAQGVTRAGSLGESAAGLARGLYGSREEFQPAQCHATLRALGTGPHRREQGTVACCVGLRQPGEACW